MTPYGLMHQVLISQTSQDGEALALLKCQSNRFYIWWQGRLWARAKFKSTGMVVQQGSMNNLINGGEIKMALYPFCTSRSIVARRLGSRKNEEYLIVMIEDEFDKDFKESAKNVDDLLGDDMEEAAQRMVNSGVPADFVLSMCRMSNATKQLSNENEFQGTILTVIAKEVFSSVRSGDIEEARNNIKTVSGLMINQAEKYEECASAFRQMAFVMRKFISEE